MSKKDSSFDYHICMDHLWALDAAQYERRRSPSYLYKPVNREFIPVDSLQSTRVERQKHSHIITVIKSSRWLTSSGDYIGEVIFQKKYDFAGAHYKSRDSKALIVFNNLILRLKTISPMALKWNDEITLLINKR